MRNKVNRIDQIWLFTGAKVNQCKESIEFRQKEGPSKEPWWGKGLCLLCVKRQSSYEKDLFNAVQFLQREQVGSHFVITHSADNNNFQLSAFQDLEDFCSANDSM